MSETERGGGGCVCVRVKGKGVEKKRVICSFPFCSAWWLQALDFQRPHLLAHCLVAEKCVKTPPTRVDVRAKKAALKLSYKVTCVTCD